MSRSGCRAKNSRRRFCAEAATAGACRPQGASLGGRHPGRIYNAMPVAGVEALRDFMLRFHGVGHRTATGPSGDDCRTENCLPCRRSSFWTRSAPTVSICWRKPARRGIDYEVGTGLKGDDLREALAEFDGAICRSGVKITADVLEGNRRLKAIARAGVGTDNIDKEAATRLGIVVMNTPGGNTISHGRAHHRPDAGPVAQRRPGLPEPDRRPLGPQEVHGHATGRQDAGDRRPGPDRPGRGRPGPGLGDAGARLRSVPLGRSGPRSWASRPVDSRPRDAARRSTTSPSTRR